MKLVTFIRTENKEELGILQDERVLPLAELGFAFADMNDLIERATKEDLDAMRSAEGEGLPLESVRLLSPIPRPRQDVLCLGLNYTAHAAEALKNLASCFSLSACTKKATIMKAMMKR